MTKEIKKAILSIGVSSENNSRRIIQYDAGGVNPYTIIGVLETLVAKIKKDLSNKDFGEGTMFP